MCGYQLITRRKWLLDFWFLGPWVGADRSHLHSQVDASRISTLQQTFISNDMASFLNSSNAIKWTSGGIENRFTQAYLGVRMLGIHIGYNF